MKRSFIFSIIFSILIITACSAPHSSEVTATLEVTVTLPSPTETPTPLPTPSPESLLPQEVKEKFEQAGIDLTDMTNAKYDKDGLHITLEGGEVVLLTNEELEKNIFLGQDNVLQYRDESNKNVIYAFDKETGKWGVARLTPEEQLNVDLERRGLSEDKYNIGYDKDGKIELRAKGSNQLVYWDGRWDPDVIIKMVEAENDCLATEFVLVGANKTKPELEEEFFKHKSKIHLSALDIAANLEGYHIPPPGSMTLAVYLKGTNNCWGLMIFPEIMIFVPSHFLWLKANGEGAVEKVFVPRD